MLPILVLILLPGLALGYVGLRGLADKARGLRTNYTATTVLVRDRLAAEISRLGAPLETSAAASGLDLHDRAAVGRWLALLAAAHPWIDRLFLVRDDGAIATGGLTWGWGRIPSEPLPGASRAAGLVREAEAAEFRRGNLEEAVERYRQALRAGSLDASARSFIQTRIGRVLLKMRRLDEAGAAYRGVLAEPSAGGHVAGLPHTVIALLQLADISREAGRPEEEGRYRRELLRWILRHPWDLQDGYGHHLAQAARAPLAIADDLQPGLRRMQQAAADLTRLAGAIPLGGPEPRGPEALRRSLLESGAGDPFRAASAGPLGIAALQRGPAGALLGYQLRLDYIQGPMLAGILKTVDLGDDLEVAVISESGPGAATRRPLTLVGLTPDRPDPRVALFHRGGRSLEQLIARERWIYGSLIAGMLAVMMLGVAATMRAAARAAELSRLKSEFVSNVSHELKTPLSLIRMFGETLESGIVADEAQRREYYGIIRRESERLTHLIDNVLDIGRIDAGARQYLLRQDDLTAAVAAALEAYRPLLQRLGFEIDERLPARPVYAAFDRDAIVRAVVNLLQNAIRYSEHRRHVTIRVESRDREAVVAVGDRGPGIPPEVMERIFERHYRVPRAGASAATGSGLGLALVKHTMDAHGGRVEVESTPGEGTVFTLVLPLPGAQGHPGRATPVPAGG